MSGLESGGLRPVVADRGHRSDATERLLSKAYLPPSRERRLRLVEPPAGASAPTGVNDPLPSLAVPRWPTATQRKPTLAGRTRGSGFDRNRGLGPRCEGRRGRASGYPQ